jgi:hypothetical protein
VGGQLFAFINAQRGVCISDVDGQQHAVFAEGGSGLAH